MSDNTDDAPPPQGAAPHDPAADTTPAQETSARETSARETPAQDTPAEETAREAPAPEAPTYEGERIAKAMARAGVASRRDAEAMIAEGRVRLNGAVLDSPAINVTENDRVEVDGEPLPTRERTRMWLFHKPRGVVTTARDPEGRTTVFDALPEDLPRVVAIGRLDINTEGLLLLTNDGGLAKVVAHPDTGWLRRYRVRAYGETDQGILDRLKGGVTIDGMEYGPIEATLDRVQGDNLWLTLGLREGKNREVKRILEHLGLSVNRLIRLSFGPFQLGELEVGLVEEVRTRVLKDQLGPKLAAQAEVDFEGPVRAPIAPFGSPKKAQAESAPAQRSTEGRSSARPERGGRSERDRPERGARPDREERRPTRSAPVRDLPAPRRSVWRADEDEGVPRRAGSPPRRGSDPQAARAAAAERPRQRVGTVARGERRVVVERLVSEPAAEPERGSRRGIGRMTRPTSEPTRAAPSADARQRRRPAESETRVEAPARVPQAARDGRAPSRDTHRGDRFEGREPRAASRDAAVPRPRMVGHDNGSGTPSRTTGRGAPEGRGRSFDGPSRTAGPSRGAGARGPGRSEGGGYARGSERSAGGGPGGGGPGGGSGKADFGKRGGFDKGGGSGRGAGGYGKSAGGFDKGGGARGSQDGGRGAGRSAGQDGGRSFGGSAGRPGQAPGRPGGFGKPGAGGGRPGGKFAGKPGAKPGGAKPGGKRPFAGGAPRGGGGSGGGPRGGGSRGGPRGRPG